MTREEYIKKMILQLIKEHKEVCTKECIISLVALHGYLAGNGMGFTDEERRLFL